jgi:predicted transcriptional regulator
MNHSSGKPGARLHKFTLLTNHAHVLLIIAQTPDVRMREIAAIIGLTERAVQRIIDDLTTSGFIIVTKSGRRNRYQISLDHPLDHPVEQGRNLGDLVRFMLPELHAA